MRVDVAAASAWRGVARLDSRSSSSSSPSRALEQVGAGEDRDAARGRRDATQRPHARIERAASARWRSRRVVAPARFVGDEGRVPEGAVAGERGEDRVAARAFHAGPSPRVTARIGSTPSLHLVFEDRLDMLDACACRRRRPRSSRSPAAHGRRRSAARRAPARATPLKGVARGLAVDLDEIDAALAQLAHRGARFGARRGRGGGNPRPARRSGSARRLPWWARAARRARPRRAAPAPRRPARPCRGCRARRGGHSLRARRRSGRSRRHGRACPTGPAPDSGRRRRRGGRRAGMREVAPDRDDALAADQRRRRAAAALARPGSTTKPPVQRQRRARCRRRRRAAASSTASRAEAGAAHAPAPGRHTTPKASIASATFLKPAMLAPFT